MQHVQNGHRPAGDGVVGKSIESPNREPRGACDIQRLNSPESDRKPKDARSEHPIYKDDARRDDEVRRDQIATLSMSRVRPYRAATIARKGRSTTGADSKVCGSTISM